MQLRLDSQEIAQAKKTKCSAKDRLWQSGYFISVMVRQSGFALYLVAEPQRTAELCQLAMQQNCGALDYVPDKLRTAELCQLAVQQNGNELNYVPTLFFQNYSFCLAVVKHCAVALAKVEDSLIDEAFAENVIDYYRSLYFQQSTGHSLFGATYSQPAFFSGWQKLATVQDATHNSSTLVTFCFQS